MNTQGWWCSFSVKVFPGLYNFLNTHTVLVVTTLAYGFLVDTPPEHAVHTSYAALPLKQYLRPVYFRKRVYFQLFFCPQRPTLPACHPWNLHNISAGTSAYCYVTQSIYVACQKGSSSQYSTRISFEQKFSTHFLRQIFFFFKTIHSVIIQSSNFIKILHYHSAGDSVCLFVCFFKGLHIRHHTECRIF